MYRTLLNLPPERGCCKSILQIMNALMYSSMASSNRMTVRHGASAVWTRYKYSTLNRGPQKPVKRVKLAAQRHHTTQVVGHRVQREFQSHRLKTTASKSVQSLLAAQVAEHG